MSRLPALSPKKIVELLESKGFVLHRTKGSHRIYFNPETEKRVVIPYHKKDLPKGTLLEILRQAGISADELRRR